MKRVVLFFLFAFVFGIHLSKAQYGFEYDPSIPVIKSGQPLKNAWGGGLNNAQISDFDFDFDGDLDLLIFDRSRDNIRVLVQEDNMGTPYYRYFHNAKLYFPSDLYYRVQLVDYNNDGKKDIFTYGIGGIKVYKNTGSFSIGPQWELVSDLLYSQYPSLYSNLYVSSSDIPAIVDVDGDGDIDILTFHQGGEHVEYHQNQSMELYGVPDSLVYVLKNECWGKFAEAFSTNAISLNQTAYPCEGGNIANPLRQSNAQGSPKHAGSTLLAIDVDNSGVMDLLLGDVAYPSMTMLINGGSSPNENSAMISQDNNYPSNTTPVDITLFPAAFYVDVDFDGKKDLVVGANARNISENVSSIRFYKNLGTNEIPNFTYVANNLFQADMIEHGTASVPVLFDYDQDGLSDLFVGNFFRYKPIMDRESTLAYYRNTGTIDNPQFTFIDNNFLNLTQYNLGLRIVPTFGDIDNDGDPDFFLGLENGTLAYFQNTGSVGSPSFAPPVLNFQDADGNPISVNSYAYPQLFDLNKDGLLDLVIGKKNGEIAYYENTGTSENPSFTLLNTLLGGVDVSTTIPDGYAAPHFVRINDTTKLFIGNFDGDLYLYDDVDDNLGVGSTFNLVSTRYSGINVEGYCTATSADLDNDNQLNMIIGQDLGGLFAYREDQNSTAGINEEPANEKWLVYPNPTNGEVFFEANSGIQTVEIYSFNGQLIQSISVQEKSGNVDLSELQTGVYFIVALLENGRMLNERIIKR